MVGRVGRRLAPTGLRRSIASAISWVIVFQPLVRSSSRVSSVARQVSKSSSRVLNARPLAVLRSRVNLAVNAMVFALPGRLAAPTQQDAVACPAELSYTV